MKKSFCDVCGKEIEEIEPALLFWKKDVFVDLNDNWIEDICPDCFWTLYCCLNMMKETGWRPDFHEKLESESYWDRDIAGYTLSKLNDKTGLKLY